VSDNTPAPTSKVSTSWRSSAWLWVPTLYFAESIPNAVVSDTAKFLYNDLGLSAIELGVVTGSMYLAWVLKPFWSPLVDLVKTKRWWILFTQLLLALGFFGLAWAVTMPSWLFWSALFLWLIAFTSATHDIAADGFYMLGLSESDQAGFTGVRSTAYRLGMLCAKGALVAMAGRLTMVMESKVSAWSTVMLIPAGLYLVCALYHAWVLPKPPSDQPALASRPESAPLALGSTQLSGQEGTPKSFLQGYLETFTTFFAKPRIFHALLFMLFYRFSEAQLLAMVPPFLTGPRDTGALALTTEQVGIAYGTFGVVGIILGGISGGMLVARYGLRLWYWPLIAGINLPNSVYLILSIFQPTNLYVISSGLFFEQFGYGFGFTAYMLYLMYFSRGEQRTSHYALCTGFMALSIMLPQMVSGYLKTALGFRDFFVYVLIATIPSFFVSWLAWRDKQFLDYFEPTKEV